ERLTNTVASEIPHHAIAEALGVGLDRAADYVDFAARGHGLDGPVERLLRTLNQQTGFLVHVANQESVIRISMHSADECGDVNVQDVPILNHRGIGDAVADNFIE